MQQDRRQGGPIGMLARGVGTLYGFAAEVREHRKEKKLAMEQAEREASPAWQEDPPSYDEYDDDYYEEECVLESADARGSSASLPVDDSLPTLAPGLPEHPLQPLPYPVILPQRRPKNKPRGFVRAYAPLLGECKGIDEVTFLKFLKEFHRESRASPYLTAINVAAMVAGAAPSMIAMAVSAGVQVGAKVAIEMQGRYRTNTYLDKINDSLFHPRNLHCMVMTFKPQESDHRFVEVNVNSSISNTTSNPLGEHGKRFRSSDGTTTGEKAIPEAAPLVFPAVERFALTQDEDGNMVAGKGQNALKRSNKFIANYIDRRSQAKYAGTHGESSRLAIPGATEQKFASRFSDPNHPVNSGDLVAFATGGKFDSQGLRKITGKDAQRGGLPDIGSLSDTLRAYATTGRDGGGLLGSVRQFMSKDVLYLLIAEIPSESEMERLRNEMGQSA